MKTKILFVCMGNICRSPVAEGVGRVLAEESGKNIEVSSAGTGSWHVGDAPDSRMRKVAAKEGFPIDDLQARVILVDDFYDFDWIVVMDEDNQASVNAMRPKDSEAKVVRLLEYGNQGKKNVPDPYYGSQKDFENSFRIIRQGVEDFFSVL